MGNKIQNVSRILILISSLLLILTFFFPLWKIGIWAPQYPEGLELNIWTSKMAGDLTTVNILNHYIGMKAITPTDIPELSYFPIVFAILLGFGILTAIIGRKIVFYLWFLLLMSFSIFALYDFYKWEYDYGHNLNPDAAIKVEGMSYQPPLIGTKEILNIEATSLPDIAGYAFTGAIILACIVFILEVFRKKKPSPLISSQIFTLFFF